MLKTSFRYLNLLFFTLLILLTFSFFLPYLFPGDLVTNMSGITPASEQQRDALERALKLDQSIAQQFKLYVENIYLGDWGVSTTTNTSIFSEVTEVLPATLELVFYALIIAIFIGIPIGIIAGLKHHNILDFTTVSFSIAAYSFPVFWLAMIFITVFCLQLGWLPTSGRIDLLYDIPTVSGFIMIDIALSDVDYKSQAYQNAISHMVLPTLSVAIITMALFIRFVRRSMMDVMSKEYIVAAKSRGFSSAQIVFKHGIKNALIPILPILALQVSTLITNVMIVETVFAWPGIGKWLIESIYQRDYPAIRIGMLIVSVLVLVMTISTEFLTRLLDPARENVEHATV
ncbi:MAG: ABC transporter permease [Pseudomonadota bacterium]